MGDIANSVSGLLASRKSIVGIGAIVLVGLLLFFYRPAPGGLSLEAAIGAVTLLAKGIIDGIAKEDAAVKSSMTYVVKGKEQVQ